MTILIVDDSAGDRKLLKKDLIRLGEDEADICEAGNGEEFLRLVEETGPHIVFLDIELGTEHAFKLLDKIPDRNFELIFTTGHIHYAKDSYDYDAVHYLGKPTDPERLQRALEKAKQHIRQKNIGKKQENLLYSVSDFPKFEQRIILAELGQTHNRRINEVLYIKSGASASIFHFFGDDGVVRVSKNLVYYERALKEYHFVRVHRDFLVNMFHVTGYLHTEDSAILEGGQKVPVSRSYHKDFKEALYAFGIK